MLLNVKSYCIRELVSLSTKKESSWQEAPNKSEPPAIPYVPIPSISRETEALLSKLDE